ncbi:MAG: KpsF/GutQ family sugar-phosphate isomerase [Devosiaceae bacterium]|nr:KpsF/GutQ family sugar-phosphate isomerase [Devosiaceae bacterium MH13]
MAAPASDQHRSILTTANGVLEAERAGLRAVQSALNGQFVAAVERILSVRGRVILSGMGKSGHIAAKIAATFASTGTPAQFVHPAEASHGDLGMITGDDLCLLISNSGETRELADLVAYTRRFSIPMIAITKNLRSTLARQADLVLQLPDVPEACTIGMAPTTSTTCTLALGDALAVSVMNERDFDASSFSQFHPGGQLGAELIEVSALMESGPELPRITPDAAMDIVLDEMNAKGLGIALIVDGSDTLMGVITDGDLRRNLNGVMEKTAIEIATQTPQTIAPDALAAKALQIMNARKITVLAVVDAGGHLQGVLHMHACLRAGLV